MRKIDTRRVRRMAMGRGVIRSPVGELLEDRVLQEGATADIPIPSLLRDEGQRRCEAVGIVVPGMVDRRSGRVLLSPPGPNPAGP